MTRRTKRRIRKAVMFARGLFLGLFAVFILLFIMTANGPNLWIPIGIFAAAIVCFGISIFCDCLLGGYKSPFYY